MYKLFKINDDKYIFLNEKNREFEGSLRVVVSKMLREGFQDDAIFLGLEALDEGYDVSEYGFYKTFLYCRKLTA